MDAHKKSAPKSVNIAVITLSDSKYKDYLNFKNQNKKYSTSKKSPLNVGLKYLEETENNDISGKLIVDALKKNNKVIFYSVIPDDSNYLISTITEIIDNYNVDAIITTGGTGIGPRDITIETVKPLFNKELNGFGEIFRYESYKELGTGAILSRSTSGVYNGKLIVSMPGSPNAVKLGLKIIMPELGHLVKHLKE